MVLKLSVWRRSRLSALKLGAVALLQCALWSGVSSGRAVASDEGALKRLAEAQQLFMAKQYFQAARYAFSAADENPARKAEAHAWISRALVEAGLEQSASYFFIQVLRSGDKSAIKRVLPLTDRMLWAVGPDMLGTYLTQFTQLEEHDSRSRSAFLYVSARDSLLAGNEKKALALLSSIDEEQSTAGEMYQLRAAAHSAVGNLEAALSDFRSCERFAANLTSGRLDLESRCLAGQARILYEKEQFAEADRVYDRVSKQSIIWTEILFEQGWNSFRRNEFNRSLGKVVSYKSPALAFVHNPEIDVLRAQSYLALCLYSDANEVVNEFNTRYAALGEEIKQLLEKNSGKLSGLFDAGKIAAAQPLQSSKPMNRLMNRFVRSPSFQRWVKSERDLTVELQNIRTFAASSGKVMTENGKGFPDFLQEILNFRLKSIRATAGAFVKNSLMDHHSELISNFEKMAFIKLEMLRRFKEQLMTRKPVIEERGRGNITPTRRDDQFYWSFNGEFWNDELGDYVFGLESACHG